MPMIADMSSMRSIVLVAVVLACNTDSSDSTSTTGTTGASTTKPGPTTADATSAPTTSGAATATTGASAPGETVPTSEPMTTEGSLDTTGLVATGGPPPSVDLPPPPAEGDYAARVIPGDPARLSVRKADMDSDLCATITFVGPADGSPLEYDVQLPATWFVQGALIHQGAADCLGFAGFPDEPIMAYAGNGAATWAGACPATIDIDVTLVFPQELPWVPVEVLLQASAVPVTGC